MRLKILLYLIHVSLKEKKKITQMTIFPAKHYLIAKDASKRAVASIRDELKHHLPTLNELEKQRLEMRTNYDLEMIAEIRLLLWD